MSDPLPAPSFNLQYTVSPMDIGSGYAAGISQMGQSIGGAITGLFGGVNPKTGEVQQGIFGQQRAADETLQAMKQSGMLSQEQYDAVAGKSLAAKQAMTGMFANQWIADMQARRQMALEQARGQVETQVSAAKLQQTIEAVKGGYGAAAGVKVGSLPVTPSGANPVTPQATNQQSAVPPGMGTPPAPVVAPKLNIGGPLGAKEQIPQGARIGTLHGQRGVLMPDGVTFRPLQ